MDSTLEVLHQTYGQRKIVAWWNVERCPIPCGTSARSVMNNIKAALSDIKYTGTVLFWLYGDSSHLPYECAGDDDVILNTVPPGANGDYILMRTSEDMFICALDDPVPANYLVISGDEELVYVLNLLGSQRYNIFLAYNGEVFPEDVTPANYVWSWTNLSRGHGPEPREKFIFQDFSEDDESTPDSTGPSSPKSRSTDDAQVSKGVKLGKRSPEDAQ